MKFRSSLLAASLLVLTACATTPASDSQLQGMAGLFVSIGQHGEGADIAESSAEIDAQLAAAPEDPYLLKLAAMTRSTLSGHSQDRAERVSLRQAALTDYDRAIMHSKPDDPPRTVMINGQEMEIDFRDLAADRAQLFRTIQTDR